jgi:hypothetical protein
MMPPPLIMEGVNAQLSYIAGAGNAKLTMNPQGFVDTTGIFLSWLEDFSKWRGGNEAMSILYWHSSRSPLHVGLAARRLGIVVVMLAPNCARILYSVLLHPLTEPSSARSSCISPPCCNRCGRAKA